MSALGAILSGAKALVSGKSAVAYLAAGLALAILLGWLFWSRASIKADLIATQADLATAQVAYDAAHAALDESLRAQQVQEAALAVREATIATINDQREALRRELAEVMRHDADALDWASQPVPASVRGLLQ